jgi:hypothetical protein
VKILARLASLAGALALTACASSGSSAGHPRPLEPTAPPSDSGASDATTDWHVLVLVPFGVLLKESPVPLHEVLLFHDETSRAESDTKDCFSIGGAPPRFLGQDPDPYLLCFDHDRLARVDAAVHLPAADAAQVFARACALWLKNTASTMTSGTTCQGRDGGVEFSARLQQTPEETLATLSMTLTDRESLEAVNDAPARK